MTWLEASLNLDFDFIGLGKTLIDWARHGKIPTIMDAIAQTLQTSYAIDETDESRLLNSLPFTNPESNQPGTSVCVAQIRSLVCKGKGSMPGTGYLVPGFAVH